MTRQLALVELRRMLRNLYLWAAVAATLALLIWTHWDQMPNLDEAVVNGAMATFIVAATMMVLANLATLRDQRHGMPETLAALPGRAAARTRAVLLAAGGLAAVLAGGIIGGFLLVRLAQGPPIAGLVDVREVLAAVAGAAIMATAGVMLARWLPSLITAPVVLGGFAMFTFVGVVFVLVWYLPLTSPYDIDVYRRPTGPRLFYLVGALVLVASLALLRHGRRWLRLGAAVAALAVMVPASVAIWQAAPPAMAGSASSEDLPAGEPDPRCVERSEVTYCHLPGFGSWIPLWAEGAEPIAAVVPPAERDRLPAIVQRSDGESWGAPAALEPGEVVVGLTWGRGDRRAGDRTQLAGLVAGLVTGLDQHGAFAEDQGWCDGRDQARTVVALWLAGQAAPVQPATPGENWDGSYREGSYLDSSVGYGEREVGYAEALLERDDARERVWQHWDELVGPDTSIDDALPLLGLPDQFPAEPRLERPCG